MVSVSVPDSLVFFLLLRYDGHVDTTISSAVMISIVERQPINYIIL